MTLPVPDLSQAAAYARAQQHGQDALNPILPDAAIVYALVWLWRKLTTPAAGAPLEQDFARKGTPTINRKPLRRGRQVIFLRSPRPAR
jgi:hypothetical protein